MPLYFAYGANMDEAAMALRCPASRALGPARLPRHRFVITTDGYASIVRDPRANVHGVLWDLSLADMPALDRFENVASGLYAKIFQPVIAEMGPRRAVVYVGRGAEGGRPRAGYLQTVIAAATRWNLPSGYVAGLARMNAQVGGRAELLSLGSAQDDTPPTSAIAKVRTRAFSPTSTVSARRGPPASGDPT